MTTDPIVPAPDDTARQLAQLRGRIELLERQIRDLNALAQRLTPAGHTVAPMDFDAGGETIDTFVDVPAYCPEPHLRLALGGFATPSFGLIIQKGE